MSSSLKDSANKSDKKIWMTLFEAVKKQYEQGNERLYLRQKYGTAELFSSGKRMFDALQAFGSTDTTSNKNGVIKIEYRNEHAQFLSQIRPNLFDDGAYFMLRHKCQETYNMYNAYINCAYHPLFKKYDCMKCNKLIPGASYWAAYDAYELKNHQTTSKHTLLVLKDTTHYVYMLQYLVQTYREVNDTTLYLKTLEEGFSPHLDFPFFFPRLVDYYVQNHSLDQILHVINQALSVDSTNQIYRFAKGTVLLNTGQYDECIEICDGLVAGNDNVMEPYLNAGLVYFNQTIILDGETQVSRQHRQMILNDYRKVLPYLERYRQLAPSVEDRWSLPLYTIYLNLNMGKKFDEIDKVINAKKGRP